MSTVLQSWVQKLPWKMQSVLLSALRGPDSVDSTELKKFTRWLRHVTQNDADPTHTYMRTAASPAIDEERLAHEIEYGCTWHYLGHLLHALEIIAYRGGQGTTRSGFATYWYLYLVDWMHLHAETPALLDERLKDKVDHD